MAVSIDALWGALVGVDGCRQLMPATAHSLQQRMVEQCPCRNHQKTPKWTSFKMNRCQQHSASLEPQKKSANMSGAFL